MSNETASSITLRAFVAYAGSQKKAGDRAGVSQNTIWMALRSRRVSAELAVACERGSGGRFKREDFRPDLFLPREAAQ